MAVELSPETALYHYDLGLALFDLEQNEAANEEFSGILASDPRLKEAVKLLKLATELEPRCAGAWYDLGLAHARLKHRKAARQCFLKSLELRPECAWSYYDLACLDALEGRRNAAFENLMQAVARGFRNLLHMRRDADLRSIRRDVRWKELVKHMGQLEYANN